jgi:hypothetical protein
MDEQDPRLAAERASARGAEDVTGLDWSAGERRSATRMTRRTVDSAASSAGASGYAAPLPGSEDERRTREIRADIEQTREELSETVTAIQERLRPANVAASAVDAVKSAASERAGEMADSEAVQYVRANPIPAAMVGIGVAGLAWMMFGGRPARSSTYQYGDYRTSSAGMWPREEAGYYSPGAYAQAGQLERGDTTYRVRPTTSQAQRAVSRTWNESPLLIGTAAMLAGAIVGLAIPETEREHQLMGDARDTMVDNVQRAVGEKVSQVQGAAAEAVGRVQEVAKNAVGLSEENSGR